MVVEFANAEQANLALQTGLIWDSEYKKTELYDRACRIQECFKCHKYGHISAQCGGTKKCGICAEGHRSEDCPSTDLGSSTRKCASCGGPHKARDNKCPEFQKEMVRVQLARNIKQTRWRVPTGEGQIGEVWHLIATCKTRLRRQVAKEWAQDWKNGTAGRATFSMEQRPDRRVLDKHTGLLRPINSLITQLRTGKIGMAHHLHTIGRADSPRCLCDLGIQTVRHVLVECLRTQDLREELLGRANDTKKILRDSALAKATAILMLRSNLLGQFQAVEETPEDLAPSDAV